MDDELTIFTQTAGTTLVALMATDAFQRAKQAVVELWHRVRPADTAAVSDQMEATRAALMQARTQGDTEREEELATWWQDRLAVLFAADPCAIDTLHRALTEVVPDVASHEHTRIGSIRITAKARDRARVFQAGRDQHIVDR
ncbi:hypothetical protein GCM10009654_65250 [Streptomyces hebeiensis]|uniref:Uncharacterized protein n=1 Tax=Streptomyces hebeiensis TaxID=229486 RepID=A0ABN1V8C8_9ACTN